MNKITTEGARSKGQEAPHDSGGLRNPNSSSGSTTRFLMEGYPLLDDGLPAS